MPLDALDSPGFVARLQTAVAPSIEVIAPAITRAVQHTLDAQCAFVLAMEVEVVAEGEQAYALPEV